MLILRPVIGNLFVPEALLDAQPKDSSCMPGTQEAILSKAMDWVKDNSMTVFWLTGVEGSGKTSFLVTLCRMLQDDPNVVLGGAFFCSRSSGSVPRTEARRIIPTMAISLASRYPEFAAPLVSHIEANAGVADKPYGDQLASLLIRPSGGLTIPDPEAASLRPCYLLCLLTNYYEIDSVLYVSVS